MGGKLSGRSSKLINGRMRDNINVKKALDKFGKSVIQQSRSRLTKDKSNYSKELYNGLKYDVSNNSLGMSFSMPFHGAVLDEGISGTEEKHATRFRYKASSNLMGFEAATGTFAKWAKFKGYKGRSKVTGRFVTNKQFGFMIANGVKKKGRKGTQFFTKSFDQQFKKLPDLIAESVALDIEFLLK